MSVEIPEMRNQEVLNNNSKNHFVTKEWIDSIVGREWEVFWRQDAMNDIDEKGEKPEESMEPLVKKMDALENDQDMKSSQDEKIEEDDDDDDKAIDHEEDWYEATVESMLDNAAATNSDPNKPIFRVRFVGEEDTVYEMVLTPACIRPSAAAWIKRTIALLAQPQEIDDMTTTNYVTAWQSALPFDTRTLQDRDAFAEIEKQVETKDFCCTSNTVCCNDQLSSPLPTEREFLAIRAFVCLVRQQIHLRGRLAEIIIQPGENGPTEAYVNDLLHALRQLDNCCQWYYRCWVMHSEIFCPEGKPEQSPSLLDKRFLFEDCLTMGCRTVIGALVSTLDTTAAGMKRRRGLSSSSTQQFAMGEHASKPESPQSPTSSPSVRRTKRRKKAIMDSFSAEFFQPDNEGSRGILSSQTFIENFFIDGELPTTVAIKQLTNEFNGVDNRWYSQSTTKMILSLSCNCADPIIKWQHRAEFYLGDRRVLDVEKSDGETTKDLSDMENYEDDDRHESDNEKKSVIKYEEIESAIEMAQQHRVLRRFNFSALITRLREKLSTIDAFEVQAWSAIRCVLNENNSSIEHKEHQDRNMMNIGIESNNKRKKDATVKQIESLLQATRSIESAVYNVSPIGRVSSPLTENVLENAIVYREWFLDLQHAEVVRERVAFVDEVVSKASNLPLLPSFTDWDISVMLASVMPRVQALSKKRIDHIAIFNRLQSQLSDRTIYPTKTSESHHAGANEFLTMKSVQDHLTELSQAPVISIAEEMLAARSDVLTWKVTACQVLQQEGGTSRPDYQKLVELKERLDSILNGTSNSRSKLVAHCIRIKSSDKIDEEIRQFSMADLQALCGSFPKETERIYKSAFLWKERADSILISLKAFGNPHVYGNGNEQGSIKSISIQKTTMVDLNRIKDLLGEYDDLEVRLDYHHLQLTSVRDESEKWSSNSSKYLLDDSHSFESCYALASNMITNRPRGVIVNPTRQEVNTLVDLLKWYIQVKNSAKGILNSQINDGEQLLWRNLLSEGLEILELFSKNRSNPVECKFVVIPSKGGKLLTSSYHRPVPVLSVAKLKSSPLCCAVLGRIVGTIRDEREGWPLLSSLVLLWQFVINDFISKCSGVAVPGRSKPTLRRAMELLRQNPLHSGSSSGHQSILSTNIMNMNPGITSLVNLVEEGQRTESNVRATLALSKGLLKECMKQVEAVRSHLSKLRFFQTDLKSRVSGVKGLVLPSDLETTIDQDVKVFAWLVRALQYPVLRSDEDDNFEVTESGEMVASPDNRVPWDVLVSLHDRIPTSEEGLRDFSCIVLRVQELYDAASQWQEDVSILTNLSLRGRKRRNQIAHPAAKYATDNSEAEESPTKIIQVKKVAELSNHPIMLKVALPRESAIRKMLANIVLFEEQLHLLLGKDYDGIGPDRAVYPKAGSIVDTDGTFILFRLTGSPLFHSLKQLIDVIAKIANEVHAETPGKATFDWICKAVAWIDSIVAAVCRNDAKINEFDGDRLGIKYNDASRLLREGELILLNVPDDLRKTLGQHRLSVSTTKEGKLTVRSMKGGAHHSVGGTAIRWCPLLYESLKGDVSRTESWKQAMQNVSVQIHDLQRKQKNESYFFQQNVNLEKVDDLLEQAADLVVFPGTHMLESSRILLSNLRLNVDEGNDPKRARKFAEMRFTNDSPVLRDRFLLLDSLIHRTSISPAHDYLQNEPASKLIPFRSAARTAIENALLKGIQVAEIASNSNEASTYCAMKAWEIEQAMFNLLKNKLNESLISPEYRDKIRTLKRSLEDQRNSTLCLRVLAGQIAATDFINIPNEQLASRRIKLERLKAMTEAKQNSIISWGASDKTTEKNPRATKSEISSGASDDTAKKNPLVAKSEISLGAYADTTKKNPPVTKSEKKTGDPSAAQKGSELDVKSPPDAQHLVRQAQPSEVKTAPVQERKTKAPSPPSRKSAKTLGDLLKTVHSSQPALPPPSLVPSIQATKKSSAQQQTSRPAPPPPLLASMQTTNSQPATKISRRSSLSSRDNRISNAVGGDKFLLSLQEGTLRFSSVFYGEEESLMTWVNGKLPEKLSEKGRLKIPEFTKFVSDKLKGNHWVAVPLRVTTVSDKDAKEYKKFYKYYEAKKRIAMFALDNSEKMFLVTPKFHKAAELLNFSNPTSTYAFVLVRHTIGFV